MRDINQPLISSVIKVTGTQQVQLVVEQPPEKEPGEEFEIPWYMPTINDTVMLFKRKIKACIRDT